MSEKKFKNILVVDDDQVLTKLLFVRLKDNGFNVTATNDAPEGLQLAMDEKPDLIILDVMMPIINGYNFCKLIKNEDAQKHIKILLLTSRDDLDDVKIGMEMGADAYLTKPVDIEDLLKTIKILSNS